MTAADQPTTEPSGDDPIPRYAQLDVWMSLYGSHRSQEYEPYREQHGFALTWANLCWEVSRRAPQPAADKFDNGWDEAQWEAWSNDVASEMPEEWDSDEGQEAIILRFVKYATEHLAACPSQVEAAADTETEVQWGVRDPNGDVTDRGSEQEAKNAVWLHGKDFTVVTSTKTVTRTPWEEA